MKDLQSDLRYALRSLRRSPAVTGAAILSLALGIGANTALFSFVNAYFLRPFPAHQPSRLVWVYGSQQHSRDLMGRFLDLSYPDFLDYRAQSRAFSGLASSTWLRVTVSGSGDEAEILRGELVSGDYFQVLGVGPALGRTLSPDDDQAGAPPVVVLSHDLWRRRYGADPEIVGRALLLNRHPFTVVGVAAPGYLGPYLTHTFEFWVPASNYELVVRSPSEFLDRNEGMVVAIGRLRAGVSREAAQAEMETLAARLAREYPRPVEALGVRVVPFHGIHPVLRDRLARTVGLLMATVGGVLLIVCANVANLLLARAAMRGREIALRQALGAGGARLVRLLLVESLLLSLSGGTLGLLFASWGRQLLRRLEPAFLPLNSATRLEPDLRILAFTLVLSLLTALVFGLAPALRASQPDVAGALRGRSGAKVRRRWLPSLRQSLVVAQVALSVVALVGAGLFLRSVWAVQGFDAGFDADRLLTVSFDLEAQGHDAASIRALCGDLLAEAGALPGVTGVALAEHRPLHTPINRENALAEGQAPPPDAEPPVAYGNRIGPGYLKTLGIPLLKGRDFEDSDAATAVPVAIVNERMARRLWPGEEALGKRLRLGAGGAWLTVVGVAADSKVHRMTEEPKLFYYQPLVSYGVGELTLHVRAAGDPATLLPAVRRAVRKLDPNMPLRHDETISAAIAQSLGEPRATAALLALLGFLALVLAAVGVYGVVTYTVAQRMQEMGLRQALGAAPAALLRLVVGQSALVVGGGVVLGLVTAAALSRLVASLLYGVHPLDSPAFAFAGAALLVVGVAASLVPARRATRSDPLAALRVE